MFVILLLGVGAAYWLVTVRTNLPRKRGEDIVETFLSKKLSEWMDTRFVQSTFVFRNHTGKQTGKRTIRRWFSDGRFLSEAKEEVLTNGGWSITETTWGLADDLSECYYSAMTTASSGQARTEIILRGEKLSVIRHEKKIRGKLQTQSGTAEIPYDYIPDGALLPILRLVAVSGESAGFRMAVNSHIVAGKNVRFSGIIIEPLGPNKVQTRDSFLGGTTKIYHIDDDGEIKQIDIPGHGITITRVSISREQPEQINVSAGMMGMLQKMGWP